MITYQNGQYRSERTPEELVSLLRTELNDLKEGERELLALCLAEVMPEGASFADFLTEKPEVIEAFLGDAKTSNILGDVADSEFIRQPVDMETFVSDPYYLGNTCDNLFPVWRRDLEELFSGNYQEVVFTGAIGCLRGDTPIHDPLSGTTITVRERWERGVAFHVWALSSDGPTIARAEAPIQYPVAPMRRVVFADGSHIVVTPNHKFWDGRAWITAASVSEHLRVSGPFPLVSSVGTDLSTRAQGGPRWTQTAPGSRGGCPQGLHFDGVRPPSGTVASPAYPPSPDGVRARTRGRLRSGVPAGVGGHNRSCPLHALPARRGFSPRTDPSVASHPLVRVSPRLLGSGLNRGLLPLPGVSSRSRRGTSLGAAAPPSTERLWVPGGSGTKVFLPYPGAYHFGCERQGAKVVVAVDEVEPEPYYDFHVPAFNNYSACGVWNHNTGKTFAASIVICRILYELSCLRDPQKSLGLAPGSNISILCLSVNEVLATKVAFDNIATKLSASPYFQEHFPFEPTKKELRFPFNIWVAPRATTDTSALGLNALAAFMDESDFIKDVSAEKRNRYGLQSKAETIYYTLQRRLKSRFGRRGRSIGKLVVVSSKSTTEGFTQQLIRRSMDNPLLFVRDYAQWETKPADYFDTERFTVMVGNDTTPSKILTAEEALEYESARPEGTILIEVPESFRRDFEHDLEAAIRDLAGVATVAISPFITRRNTINDAVAVELKHPFHPESWIPTKPGGMLWDEVVSQVSVVGESGDRRTVWRPKINPKLPRAIHIDLGFTGDAAGFAMGHVPGFLEVLRRDRGRNERLREVVPIIVFDFLLQVLPPAGDEIMAGDLRELVYGFSAHGYLVEHVTMDSYQSRDSLQQFAERGYHAAVQSVDRNSEPYDALKEALYEGRVLYYDYAPALRELRTVERNYKTGKIDHPKTGTKDVSDAMAGVAFKLSGLYAGRSYAGANLPVLPLGSDPRELLRMGQHTLYRPMVASAPILLGEELDRDGAEGVEWRDVW